MTNAPKLRVVPGGDPDPIDIRRPLSGPAREVRIRPALPRDVEAIEEIVHAYAVDRILLPKDLVGYYEDVQEFLVAIDPLTDEVVGCGALHVMWRDLAEVRTLAVTPQLKGHGIGHLLVQGLLDRARRLGLERVFCLTFEVGFFVRQGFREISGTPVSRDVYQELLHSHDDGVAEFLDLARVKPNTLGNSRMLIELAATD